MSEKKGINTTELTLLIVGSTIGSGVFGITSDLATAAAPGPAIIAWIIVGIGVLTLVLSLTNLSQKRPDLDSGIFSYAAAAFGPLGEFISGWALIIIVAKAILPSHAESQYAQPEINSPSGPKAAAA